MAEPIAWMGGEIQTPPFGRLARRRAGYLLGRVQMGETIGLPSSRPMPSIGAGCHELRIQDSDQAWRIVYGIEPSAIVILEVFAKKTQDTPRRVIDACRRRLAKFREDVGP